MEFRIHKPLRSSAAYTILFVLYLFILYLNFYSNVYGILYTRTYTDFSGISRYCTVKNFAELRKIKSIPHKIPYSAEFQTGTSENTLGWCQEHFIELWKAKVTKRAIIKELGCQRPRGFLGVYESETDR